MSKRTITEIKVTEEEDTASDSSTSSTLGDGVVTFILILAIMVGLHSLMSRRNQPIIDQRGNSGTIVNEWEGSYER